MKKKIINPLRSRRCLKSQEGVELTNRYPRKYKWRFKNLWVVKSGLIFLTFFVDSEAGCDGKEKCGSEEAFFRLVAELPKNQSLKAYFDKRLSAVSLLPDLKSIRILYWNIQINTRDLVVLSKIHEILLI